VTGEHPVQRPAAEAIGESGERLTRDEAFQLVRQAVESLTRDEDDAARASDVRVRARELLGRDSESLGERMFTRILRDAHDADMVDLRGDDFEVARAVASPSVREQLVRAESAATPSTTGTALSSAAAARRGMGPRSAPGRGVRGRPGLAGPPPDLFAVGVIEEPSIATFEPTVQVAAEAPIAAPDEEPAAVPPAASRSRAGAKRGARKAPVARVPDAAETQAPVAAAKKTRRGGAARKTGAKRAAKPKAAE